MEAAKWTKLLDVQQDFKTAEAIGIGTESYTVFNICHNRFRLVVRIHYPKGVLWVKNLLTHAEYDKETWKAVLLEEQRVRALRRKQYKK